MFKCCCSPALERQFFLRTHLPSQAEWIIGVGSLTGDQIHQMTTALGTTLDAVAIAIVCFPQGLKMKPYFSGSSGSMTNCWIPVM